MEIIPTARKAPGFVSKKISLSPWEEGVTSRGRVLHPAFSRLLPRKKDIGREPVPAAPGYAAFADNRFNSLTKVSAMRFEESSFALASSASAVLSSSAIVAAESSSTS